jgi:hypothetical protein
MSHPRGATLGVGSRTLRPRQFPARTQGPADVPRATIGLVVAWTDLTPSNPTPAAGRLQEMGRGRT